MKTTFITLIALAFTASAQLVKFEDAKAVQYKEASGAKLFLHVFNPEGHKTTDARPAIVFFFGHHWIFKKAPQIWKIQRIRNFSIPNCSYSINHV